MVYDRYVRQGERNASGQEDLDLKIKCAAHHEAGHIVIAAAQGLSLRPEGLSVDPSGEGLACYCKRPNDSDISRERAIVTMLAGFMAQRRFCEEHSYPAPDPIGIILSPDWQEARQVISRLSAEAFSVDNATTILAKLENRSQHLVEQNWLAIEELAITLLAKEWEPLKALNSGSTWSSEFTAKYVAGEEVVGMLGQYGITAVCDPDR